MLKLNFEKSLNKYGPKILCKIPNPSLSKIVIKQWKKLIFETEIHQEVINLLKKMLKSGTIFRNPIYMAFDVYPRCLPVIRHSLVNYRNVFLANEKFKTQSIYPLAKSNLNNDVMEYLMAYFTNGFFYKTEYTPQKFAIVTNENPEVLKLLKFYLEYVAANYACEHLSYINAYTFFFHIFNELNRIYQKKGCWAAAQAGEILESIEKNFQYFSGAGHWDWPFNQNLLKQKIIYCGLPSILL